AGFGCAHASGWGDRTATRAKLARPSLRRRLVGAWAALCAAAGFVWAHASGWGDRTATRAKLARPSLRRRLVGAWGGALRRRRLCLGTRDGLGRSNGHPSQARAAFTAAPPSRRLGGALSGRGLRLGPAQTASGVTGWT